MNGIQTTMDAPDLARRFGGVTRLYGAAGAARLQAAHVVVVGIGGVGSWAAEAAARCAIGHITLVDMDHVAESNTNRQIHALGDAFGQAKVDAMAARIRAINPACAVTTIDEFVSADNVAALIRCGDVVLDCVDQVNAKAAMIAHGRDVGIPVISCGAAGGRVDPTRIACGDLGVIAGDPLLARVRHRLRREYAFPREARGNAARFGVLAVYSDEPIRRPVRSAADAANLSAGLACAGYGSSVVVTATMGFVAASAALAQLVTAGPRA
jgi:tRNA A37 threonylcarbamoyladenosine dehydratase